MPDELSLDLPVGQVNPGEACRHPYISSIIPFRVLDKEHFVDIKLRESLKNY